MNDLKIFSHKDFGGIRVLEKDGQPWFVGKDVANILGYTNSRKALGDHVDSDEKGVTKWDTPGGEQELVIINESGLYSLILSSKLPKAKEFKRWVTSEVLPSIRQTGGYFSGGEAGNDMEFIIRSVVSQTTAAIMTQLPAIISEAVKSMLNLVPRDTQNFELNAIEWNEIAYWEDVLAEWREFRRGKPNKDDVDRQFLTLYNAKHPDKPLSRRTLYRKWKAFCEKGGAALLDMRGKHGNHRRKVVAEITVQVE